MDEEKKCPAFIADVIRQCKVNPDRIAVIDRGGRRSTYGDFLDIIERTCGFIKSKGYPKGSFLVISLENSMEYLAVEYGAWLSGCAIAPVSPHYPQARIDYIREHCESPIVVDEQVLGEIVKAERVEECETSADIAALFYTSGSTGNPKGVIHTFETLSHIDRFSEVAEVFPNDIFGYGAPFSFIAWILTVPVLRAGACLRLFERETMTDARKLQGCIDNEGITCAVITPSALRFLDLKGNKTLRFVLTGSERVSNFKPESGYRLINLYGMTETTPMACTFDITGAYSNAPVGKPVSDYEMKLMEDGEICFRGPVTPGYYKDPERSAALWSGGWLHTGDIGRILPDGNLEYVNRKDWMVKINGQRVETGEIIQVIKEMPGVTNATAKGFVAPDGHQYVAAYYTADDSVGDDALKEFISRKLAPYMIPSYFVKMDSLPLNFNGKIDVKSLQSPLEMAQGDSRQIVKAETEAEKVLCKGFESALGISPVSVEDDFFSLGGDSIRVMQLQIACPGFELSSSLIYRCRTVRAIAKALEEEETASTSGASSERCPLSKTQAGIFVECMARRGEAVYNNPVLFRISGAVDTNRLAQACTKALSAHPNLFATIEIDANGIPQQCPNNSEGFSVEVEKVTDAGFEGIRPGLVQPFDILGGRLFRIKIYRAESSVWLFTDFHHIVFDGTSNTILLEDIEKAYDGGTVETESYNGFDLACNEQVLRGTAYFEECRKWNIDTFCVPDQTSLPDPDRFSDNVSFGSIDTPTGISAFAFAKAAERLGVTENVLATGAFGYMLGACSHSMNSAFATIYNGRKSLKTARTVSMMVKTLPVFCSWDKATLAGDYFKAIKEQLVGAMAHDLYSFAEICAQTAYDSRVLFSYQDELLERQALCGANCEMVPLFENATGEPFAVQLFKRNGSLVIRTEYRSNMYSEPYVREFISCFTNILHSLLLAQKGTKTSDFRLVSEDEQEAIIRMGWGRSLDFDRNDTVVSMFRRHVAATPEATAVVDETGSITYSELDSLSDRLATILVREGVEPEDFVALILPRLRYFPISYMACFKCGAAYVPMDCEYPIDRLQYMLENSETKVLLTTRQIFERKSQEGRISAPKVIFVEEALADNGIEVMKGIDRARPTGLAYMIYTSGTTGRPKGVMIEHRALANLVHWFIDAEKLEPGTRIAQHASFSFDGSVPDLMVSLSCGGELHILPSAIRKDLAQMYRYFCENRIDGVVLTTQLGLTMLKMYDLKLKYMMLGGEKMSGTFNTSVHLYNGYGPTEFTVCSSFHLVDPETVLENIPIGRAVPNTFSGIVDSCGRLLPKGIAGELVLVGVQLSRGYWHRDETTSERFVECTFIPGEKMYRTGDLVKWSDDGQLLFLGRIDTQVKLRGFRIELGEIESNISRYDGVKSAVVAVKEIAGVQHLCAYYCSDKEIDREALRSFLAESLTDYMVPTAYVRMDAMPMTPNGKIDIKRLPLPEIKAEEIVKPSTELEEQLFGIVAEFLNNEDFGVKTNLISMGLTSLGAITLSVQIERKASLNLPSAKILQMPTIRQWAEYLGDADSETSPEEEETATIHEKQDQYPLTDNQRGIYIEWEQHRDSIQYNVPMLFRFRGVTPEAVEQAVKAFVEAHPYLKTRLQNSGGQVVQERRDDFEVEVNVTKLETEPDRAFFQKQLKPFNLFEGPLFRFSVFSCGEVV